MSTFKIEKDDGFMEVEVPGNEQPVKLDIFVAGDRFTAAFQATEGQATNMIADELAKAMAEFGIPAMSFRTHSQIAQECLKRSEAAQKKDGLIRPSAADAGSQDSTESIPTD